MPRYCVDYYNDLAIIYPDGTADVWVNSFGWVKTIKANVARPRTPRENRAEST